MSKSAKPGTSVVCVSASDANEELNGQVVYKLRPRDGDNPTDGIDAFNFDPVLGVLRMAKALDRESIAVHQFLAVAVDCGMPPMSSTVIQVLDKNDSPPVFELDWLELRMPENPCGELAGELSAQFLRPNVGENGRAQ